jgi:predicted glutamine amidotransferase
MRKRILDFQKPFIKAKEEAELFIAENPILTKKHKHRGRRKANLKKKYGLSYDQYSTILNSQNNCCAICKKEFTKTPHIDHIEINKEVYIRGILCSQCNTGLGMFKDNIEYLLSATQYLKKNLQFKTGKKVKSNCSEPHESAPISDSRMKSLSF